jgi:hypothetical protein
LQKNLIRLLFTPPALPVVSLGPSEGKPKSENPLSQTYVEARHTLQVSPYNLSKRTYPLFLRG